MTADVRHVGMAYDRLGRVTSETSTGVAHTSTWDKGGNRLTVTYGGTGRVLTSTYDKLQRVDTLSEKLPSETTSRLTSYAYDKNGNVTGKTHPNGTAESTSYDALNRRMVHQVSVGSTVLSSFTFSHDRQSNVAQIIETYAASAGIAGRTVTNTYDKTRRLLVETAAEPGKTVATTYGYDKANNRTSKVVATTPTGGSTTTETHGYVYGNTSNGLNSNQVWKWIKPNGTGEVIYSYDANGNRATRTETIGGTPKTDTYTWDHWNRLTNLTLQSKASAVNGTYAYGYDHRTRRIVRDESAISGRTRDLVIFSGGTSVQEHEGETGATPADKAAPDMEYIRGSDWGGGVGGILYTSRAGVVSWAHYNGRGDVVTRTSGTGSLTYAATYEAFGTRTQEAGTNPDRQRANTKEEDPTGLLNEGHRYRDLELGMFISRDPAGFVDGPNVYTYVVQNPWSSFDPVGLRVNIQDKNQRENYEAYKKQFRESGDKLRTEIVDKMERSPRDFAFANPENFKKHVDARVKNVEYLRKLKAKFTSSRAAQESGTKSELTGSYPKDSWVESHNGVGVWWAKDNNWSKALADLRDYDQGELDCGRPCKYARLWAELESGNTAAAERPLYPGTHSDTSDPDDWIPGDQGQVLNNNTENVPSDWTQENTVYLEEGQFYANGMTPNPTGLKDIIDKTTKAGHLVGGLDKHAPATVAPIRQHVSIGLEPNP